MDDGTGLGSLIPPIRNADYLSSQRTEIPCIILNGQKDSITINGIKYDREMPGSDLSNVQLLNLINYINNSLGNELGYTTIKKIEEWTIDCN